MSKQNHKRVYLKDEKGNYYRIFGIMNEKDSRGEYYVKLVFPDVLKIPLVTGKHNKDGVITEINSLPNGVLEFSYHYRSGISHLKDDSNIHIDQKRDIADLHKNPALHLVRLVIRSLDLFKIQNKHVVDDNSFIIPNAFDGKPRGFELAISRISGEWNVINTQGEEPVSTYKIGLNDLNVYFHIADCVWTRNPMVNKPTAFEIFRYDNPTNNIEFITKKDT